LQNFDLSQNQMEAILGSEMDDVLITGVEGGPCGCPPVPAKAWASTILDNTRAEIAGGTERDQSEVPWPVLTLAVHAREEDIITREGLVPLARRLWLEGPSSTDTEFKERLEWFAQQAEKAGFIPADTGAVEAAVEEVVAENRDMIGERGMDAMGPLMGAVMQKLGGSADGKTVSEALRRKISELDD
jgi:Glu-tRNA(Gln) amidotransferase subunit E-like FAD-binding protein